MGLGFLRGGSTTYTWRASIAGASSPLCHWPGTSAGPSIRRSSQPSRRCPAGTLDPSIPHSLQGP